MKLQKEQSLLENKIVAGKDAILIAETRQDELKKLADLQKENHMLKEKLAQWDAIFDNKSSFI